MTLPYSFRAPVIADAAWLHETLNHVATNAALIDLPYPYAMHEVTRDWLDHNPKRLNAVLLQETNAIGCIWFNIHKPDPIAEFSFLIQPHYQKQGLGSQAIPAIWPTLQETVRSKYSFVSHFNAHTKPDHLASIRILEACGFTHQITENMPIGSNGKTMRLSRYHF